MRTTAIIVAALALAAPAAAHLPANASKPKKLYWVEKAQQRNLAHATYFCRHAHLQENRRWHCAARTFIRRELRETRAKMAASTATSSAWAWYLSSTTQCVANHEGGWTSVNAAGYYGRFQMDISFQNETAYGRKAYHRWGTADHWPPAVQVQHAYSIWKYAGWSRWPTYYAFCS